jgi:hypothetical protein
MVLTAVHRGRENAGSIPFAFSLLLHDRAPFLGVPSLVRRE